MSKTTKWAHKINTRFKDDIINTIVHGNHIRVFMWVENTHNDCPDIIFGDAFCHKKHDTFDVNVGRAIAVARALDMELPKFIMRGE